MFARPFSQQVPRPFALPGFKQPTLSFFPFNASGQFDLGYGGGSTAQAQPMQRQVSSRQSHGAQPQYSTAPPPPTERQPHHYPSSHSYSTTTYDPHTTSAAPAPARPRYSMYQSGYYDSRGYEPSVLSSRTDARTSDYDGGSDVTSSSPSSSLFSVFSAETTTTKSSVYEENPNLRGRSGAIPTFVNVRAGSDGNSQDDRQMPSSKESYAKSPYNGRSSLPHVKDSMLVHPSLSLSNVYLPHCISSSRNADSRQPLLPSNTPNLSPPSRRAAPPRSSAQPTTPTNSRPVGRVLSQADLTASPAVTIDTGSPWGRYPRDDVEAGYVDSRSVYEQGGPSGSFSQPELVSLDAQGRPVIYDEPQQMSGPSASSLRRVTSSVDVHEKPPPRRLRKVSTLARPIAAPPSVPRSTMAGGLTIDTRVPPVTVHVGFPGDDVRLGGSKRSAIPLPDVEPQKVSLSRIEALRSRRPSNASQPPALDFRVTVADPATPRVVEREPSPRQTQLAASHRLTTYSDCDAGLPDIGHHSTRSSSQIESRGDSISRTGASTPHPLRVRSDLSARPPPQPILRSSHQRMFSDSDLPRRAPAIALPVFQPIRRHSDGEVPLSATELQRARSVRWNDNLICPSPILSHQRRQGWFNRRGSVYPFYCRTALVS